jgi:hypothetical protein
MYNFLRRLPMEYPKQRLMEIDISLTGDYKIDYNTVQEVTRVIAQKFNYDAFLLSWYDRGKRECWPPDVCRLSPKADLLEIELYGISHGGHVKIDVNDGDYVFIYN